jgi:hypothetical protein
MVEGNMQLVWHKRCGTQACVEIARSGDSVLMRDSQDPDGSRLTFGQADWAAFVEAIRSDGPQGWFKQ